MKFCALIYYDETDVAINPPMGTPERATQREAYFEYGARAAEVGVVIDGDALWSTGTATSVRVRAGETITTDGPFAETKEHLGGFYVFECPDMATAQRWAAQIPHAATGTIEIRPIAPFPPDADA